jgi:hypothetical protein
MDTAWDWLEYGSGTNLEIEVVLLGKVLQGNIVTGLNGDKWNGAGRVWDRGCPRGLIQRWMECSLRGVLGHVRL